MPVANDTPPPQEIRVRLSKGSVMAVAWDTATIGGDPVTWADMQRLTTWLKPANSC
jgi:hypothetical protein